MKWADRGRVVVGNGSDGLRIRAIAVLCLATAISMSGCQSEAERLQGESIYHLDQAVKILEHSVGNTQAALVELDKYLVVHRDRMLDARARGRSVMRNMSAEDQEAFKRRAMEQTRALREHLDTLARTYSDPPRVLSKVQEFM